MIAPRRYMAENAAKFSPVYSYRFDTVPQNATIDIGVSPILLASLHKRGTDISRSPDRLPISKLVSTFLDYFPALRSDLEHLYSTPSGSCICLQ